MPLALSRRLLNKPAADPPAALARTARPALQTYCLCPARRLRSLPACPGAQPGSAFPSLLRPSLPGERGPAARGRAGLFCGQPGPPYPLRGLVSRCGEAFASLPRAEDGAGGARGALQHIPLRGPSPILLIWVTHMAEQPKAAPSRSRCPVWVGAPGPPRYAVFWSPAGPGLHPPWCGAAGSAGGVKGLVEGRRGSVALRSHPGGMPPRGQAEGRGPRQGAGRGLFLSGFALASPALLPPAQQRGRVQGELVASQRLCLGAGSSGALPVRGRQQSCCCETVRAT